MTKQDAIQWAKTILPAGSKIETLDCRWYGDLPVAISGNYRTKSGRIENRCLCKDKATVERMVDRWGQPEVFIVTEYLSGRI